MKKKYATPHIDIIAIEQQPLLGQSFSDPLPGSEDIRAESRFIFGM